MWVFVFWTLRVIVWNVVFSYLKDFSSSFVFYYLSNEGLYINFYKIGKYFLSYFGFYVENVVTNVKLFVFLSLFYGQFVLDHSNFGNV